MEWLALLPSILASFAAGFSDRDIVERMSQEERARLDELFGNAENFIADLRALPDLGGIGDLSFSGAIGGQASGPQLDKDFGPKQEPSQSITGAQFTQDEIFNNVFEELKKLIPQTPSVSDGVNIPSLSVQEVLDQLGGLGGGFLQRGDLVNRIPKLSDLPSADFSALRAEMGETIRGAAQQRAASEGEQSRRSLLSSGILPGSATFDFETELAPQRRAEESIATQTVDMEAQLEKAERELGFRRAELETAQNTTIANAMAVEEQTIAQQFGNITDLFKSATELGLQGAGLQLNANQQDIANDFQEFGAQFGITQEQFQQFENLLAQNSGLSVQAQNLIAEVIKTEIAAELEASGSTVLTTDIVNNALGAGNQMANIFGLLEGSKPKQSSGFTASILGSGGGFSSGCVAGCTQLITPKGPRMLAKVKPGDYVLGSDAQFHRVVLVEYGSLVPKERKEAHRILRTRYGELWLTDNHVVSGKPAKLWKPGDQLPFFSKFWKADAKIVAVDENAAYIPSGDLYLESGVPYVAGGFVVHSVIRPAKKRVA